MDIVVVSSHLLLQTDAMNLWCAVSEAMLDSGTAGALFIEVRP